MLSKLLKNKLGRFVRIARYALAMLVLLALTNQSGRGCYVMPAGKSVDINRRATDRRHTNRPMVSTTLMRSYLSRKAFLSGFPSQHIVVYKEENVGIRAMLCSSRVCRLVEVTRRTDTLSSHMEVACLRVQFDDWNRHDDTVLYFSVT